MQTTQAMMTMIFQLLLLVMSIQLVRRLYFTATLTSGWVASMESRAETAKNPIYWYFTYLFSCQTCFTFAIAIVNMLLIVGVPLLLPDQTAGWLPAWVLLSLCLADVVNSMEPNPRGNAANKLVGAAADTDPTYVWPQPIGGKICTVQEIHDAVRGLADAADSKPYKVPAAEPSATNAVLLRPFNPGDEESDESNDDEDSGSHGTSGGNQPSPALYREPTTTDAVLPEGGAGKLNPIGVSNLW